MAQYDGENIYYGNLGRPKGGLVASKSSLSEEFQCLYFIAKYYGGNVHDILDCPKVVLAA